MRKITDKISARVQKTTNATNQRFSSSVEPVVKYHHTATSIPNIFKSSSMFHFLRVVLNWVGVKRGQGCSRRDSCVYFEKDPTQSDVVHKYITSVTQTSP